MNAMTSWLKRYINDGWEEQRISLLKVEIEMCKYKIGKGKHMIRKMRHWYKNSDEERKVDLMFLIEYEQRLITHYKGFVELLDKRIKECEHYQTKTTS